MAYQYCSNCHDALCLCGEKYEGMTSTELDEFIAMLTKLRDDAVVRENRPPPTPEEIAAWRRIRQQAARKACFEPTR